MFLLSQLFAHLKSYQLLHSSQQIQSPLSAEYVRPHFGHTASSDSDDVSWASCSPANRSSTISAIPCFFPSAASSQLQHFSSSPLSLLSFSASPFFSALSLTAFFSSLPQLLSFHSLSFSNTSSSVRHRVFLVRAGFLLLAGFFFGSGRTRTSDKISDESVSLAELTEPR